MAATQWYQAVHATKRYRLGTVKTDAAGNQFLYSKGVGSNALGACVVITANTYTPALLTNASLKGLIGVSLSTATAAQFGWYLVKGASKNVVNLSGLVAVDTGSTDGASCSTSSATTGNIVGGGVVATKTVVGMWAQGVSASNLGDVVMENPIVAGGSLA